jgi:hypothetical protein
MKVRVDSILEYCTLALAIVFLSASTGCTPESKVPFVNIPAAPHVLGPLQEAPDRGAILRMMLSIGDYPLSRHVSCKDVGTSTVDRTISDYLAGIMAEQYTGSNTVTAGCPSKGKASYQCEVYLKHADGDDQWAWGVGFEIGTSDGAIVDGSIRCLGAG